MLVKIKKGISIETNDMSLVEMLDVSEKLQKEIDRMNITILDAKSKHATGGEYANRQWWLRINAAIKVSRANKQRLVRAISEKRKQEKGSRQVKLQKENRTFERRFMQIAKVILSDKSFHQILNLTEETHDQL